MQLKCKEPRIVKIILKVGEHNMQQHDGPRGYCVEWNKSDREREILLYDLTYINLKKKSNNNKTKLIDTNNKLVDTKRGQEGGRGHWWNGLSGQKIQSSGYKINKSWGCNVQHGNYS